MRLALRRLPWALLACAVGSCSLMIETDTTQCREDRDCERFANTVCDQNGNVCVKRALAMPSPDAAVSPDAASPLHPGLDAGPDQAAPDLAPEDAGGQDAPACLEESDAGLPSACGAATCVPFDNQSRLTIVGPDGGLRPLP
jgi:hypothetical protein